MSTEMRLTTPIARSLDEVYKSLTDPELVARASVEKDKDADSSKVTVTHTFDGKFLISSPCEDGQATMVLEPLGDGQFVAHTDMQLLANTAVVQEESTYKATDDGVVREAVIVVDSKIPLMGGMLEKRLEKAMSSRAERFAEVLAEGPVTPPARFVATEGGEVGDQDAEDDSDVTGAGAKAASDGKSAGEKPVLSNAKEGRALSSKPGKHERVESSGAESSGAESTHAPECGCHSKQSPKSSTAKTKGTTESASEKTENANEKLQVKRSETTGKNMNNVTEEPDITQSFE